MGLRLICNCLADHSHRIFCLRMIILRENVGSFSQRYRSSCYMEFHLLRCVAKIGHSTFFKVAPPLKVHTCTIQTENNTKISTPKIGPIT